MQDVIRRWRMLGIWLPVAFVSAVAAATILGLGHLLPGWLLVLIIIGVTGFGATAFSYGFFRVIDQAQREKEQRASSLAAINEASFNLSSDLDLSVVLQRVVDLGMAVTDARYGALALVGEGGTIEEFITSGVDSGERERIGPPPEGRGLLAAMRDGETLRVDDIAADPRSTGFPDFHPPMKSLLGVPITHEGRVQGDLYLADKLGGKPFTEQDEDMLRTVTAHAALAIENARLYEQVQELVLFEERDRIAMDLHDGVIQSLYATGLELENCLEDLTRDPQSVVPQLERAVEHLNGAIGDIRNYISNLQPETLADTDLAGAIGTLLQQLKLNTLLNVRMVEEPAACQGLRAEQVSGLFMVAQEALANVRKHAQAHNIGAFLEQRNGTFRLRIEDDGVGFEVDASSAGYGLRNMRERLEALGGRLVLESGSGQGTTLVAELPAATEEERG